ncbi:HAD domain-containing protein [Streptomyces longwoodensis]|uniref:HAD domain-containing protein n=1 Tax=Streptomyces longwoodensis TaxID=68231 RepID=UPI0036C6C9B7
MLLFLDIDGTLIPFGGRTPYATYTGPTPPGHPLLARLDPALGPCLLSLDCEMTWATTWGEDANSVVAPWLGLPPLPVVDWPEEADEAPRPGGVHWKTEALLARAAGRPFVWLDDEITDADRAWVAARHPAPAILHRVEHGIGLTRTDLAGLRERLARAGLRRGR